MACPLNPDDLTKLKGFIDFVSQNPAILNAPQLSFVKSFIEKFGGTVDSGDFQMPAGGKCPFSGASAGASKTDKTEDKPTDNAEVDMEEEMDSESSESDIELDMEGVIEGDVVGDQPMGDSSKTPTEEEIDQSSELRSQAAAAYSEQKFDEAIALYTKAIELNPGNALFHAKRGQAFLKLKKPNACIRDCDKALEINCDSAAAYKFRGRAHRLLGNWELAAKDLRQACKLDFDEETDEWLREVTPNAKKIEQHRIKQERREAERKRKAAEAARRKARSEQQRQQKESNDSSGADFGGGIPGGVDMSSFFGSLKDPEVSAALQDILKNPANAEKYKSNPKIAKLLDLCKNMGGGMPGGFPGGFPGMFSPGGAETPDMDNMTPPPEPSEPKAQAKKPDFVDDGLD